MCYPPATSAQSVAMEKPTARNTTRHDPTGTAYSSDGTAIAYERVGAGPAVILIDGALCYRDSGPARPLATLLAEDFTVYCYDRRGRGDSGNTALYTTEREIDDLAAVIKETGESPYVYGISSGAALALEAAAAGLPIKKVAAYEVPLVTDDTRPPIPADYVRRLESHIAAGRTGKAVKQFMREAVRVPAPFVAAFPLMPAWRKLKAVAHTLPHDHALLGDTASGYASPVPHWAISDVPTLVMGGGKSPEWMRNTQRRIAESLPSARHHTIAGQTHMLKAAAIAPVLKEFFAS